MPRPVTMNFRMPPAQSGPDWFRPYRPPAPPIQSPTELNKMLITNLPPPPPASVNITRGTDSATVTPPRTPRQVGAPDVPQIAQIDINKIWQQRKLENPLDSEASQ